jgi:glycolate oxidase iron-sulfur subunit
MFADAETFLDCVHCGLCLNACPTYLELGTEMDSPRGRIYLMRELEAGTLPLTDDVARHLDLCLGCRACETACPSGVRYGELIESARSFVEERHHRGFSDWLRRELVKLVFPHARRLRRLLLPLRILETVGILRLARRMSALAAMLPPLRPTRRLPSFNPAFGEEKHRVGLLDGCVGGVLFPRTNQATVRVLNRNACTVIIPKDQICCGALYLHAGARDAAIACARRNLDAFGEDLGAIIVNAAGCGAMLKQYGELFGGDPALAERARTFSRRVKDIHEFLVDLPFSSRLRRLPIRVAYHDACHLAHGQGIREQPRALLKKIPGLTLVELADADMCCGSAGSYNLTEPEMARRLGDRKAESIRAAEPAIVAAANPGCILQIQASLRRAGLNVEVVDPMGPGGRGAGENGETPRRAA